VLKLLQNSKIIRLLLEWITFADVDDYGAYVPAEMLQVFMQVQVKVQLLDLQVQDLVQVPSGSTQHTSFIQLSQAVYGLWKTTVQLKERDELKERKTVCTLSLKYRLNTERTTQTRQLVTRIVLSTGPNAFGNEQRYTCTVVFDSTAAVLLPNGHLRCLTAIKSCWVETCHETQQRAQASIVSPNPCA